MLPMVIGMLVRGLSVLLCVCVVLTVLVAVSVLEMLMVRKVPSRLLALVTWLRNDAVILWVEKLFVVTLVVRLIVPAQSKDIAIFYLGRVGFGSGRF